MGSTRDSVYIRPRSCLWQPYGFRLRYASLKMTRAEGILDRTHIVVIALWAISSGRRGVDLYRWIIKFHSMAVGCFREDDMYSVVT